MEKINFVNNSTPALNATNLNKLQDNIEDALEEAGAITVQTQETESDTDTYSCNFTNGKLDKTSVKTTATTSDTDTYSCNYIDNSLSSKLNTSAVKTTDTTSDNDTYSCTYTNTQLNNKLNTSSVKTTSNTSSSNVYSCSYVNSAVLDKYSTTETRTGTWINGKPVYRKVIEETMNLSSSGAHETTAKITNFEQLVKLDSIIAGYYTVTYNSAISAFGVRTDNGAIYMYTNINWDNAIPFKFIVEYTKSTD